MPNETAPKKKTGNKVGRPATGITKDTIKVTVDRKIVAEAKKIAFKNGETFSGFVARAIHSQLLQRL